MKFRGNFNLILFISKTISTLVGLIFFVSGISKILVFKSFSITVMRFLPFFSKITYLIAIFVIILEISLGFMLLIRYKLAFTSFALSILLTFFIGILMYEVMTGISIRCNCFGGLNISFPPKTQMIIDIILLNCLIILFLIHTKGHTLLNKKEWIAWIIPVLFLMILEILLIKSAWSTNRISNTGTVSFLLSFVTSQNHAELENKFAKKVFFLVSFYDFNCPLCYDDFLELSDSLKSNKYRNVYITYLFEKLSLNTESMDSLRLQIWKETNEIHSPVLLVDNKLFQDYKIRKSLVLILNEKNQLLIKKEFPIGAEARKNILHYLLN